jgi:hypothetical protein
MSAPRGAVVSSSSGWSPRAGVGVAVGLDSLVVAAGAGGSLAPVGAVASV